MAVKASAQITLTYVVDVKAVYRYYLLQSANLSAPSKPVDNTYPPATGSWDDVEPAYNNGSTEKLYFVDCTVFNDNTCKYSDVSLSSSYEAAKLAYNKAANAEQTAQNILTNTIYGVDVMYAQNTSNTTAPTSGWSTTAPAWASGKYMWQKTVITYGDGSTDESKPTCITGATGATGSTGGTGAAGKGVSSIVEQYYQSTSSTSLSGGSWSTTYPGWVDGKYIWTRSVISYTSGDPTTTTAVCVTGGKGATGSQGPKGDTGGTGPQGPQGVAGSSIWTTTTAPTTPNYTFTISNLTGGNGTAIKVGDVIKYSYYMYTVSSVSSTTVLASTRVSIRGSTGTGAKWYAGTAITGTSTTATVFSGSGISSAVVGDMYLNTSTSNTYRCTTAGAASAAKWVYVSNIKGAMGDAAIWYEGTAITGTSTTANIYSSSEVSSAKVGDMYLNTDTSNVYRCTTAGNASTAKWVYVSNIGGNPGDPGADGQTLYATSNSSITTAAKVATLSTGTLILKAGVSVNVKFTYANSAVNPTLNVSDTGAKAIYTNGSRYAYWSAGQTVLFTYDGTNWQVASTPVYANTVTVGNSSSNNVYIDSNSVDIRSNTRVLASFGERTVIGNTETKGILLENDGGISFWKDGVVTTSFKDDAIYLGQNNSDDDYVTHTSIYFGDMAVMRSSETIFSDGSTYASTEIRSENAHLRLDSDDISIQAKDSDGSLSAYISATTWQYGYPDDPRHAVVYFKAEDNVNADRLGKQSISLSPNRFIWLLKDNVDNFELNSEYYNQNLQLSVSNMTNSHWGGVLLATDMFHIHVEDATKESWYYFLPDALQLPNTAALKWASKNGKNPYFGYATDQVDGTYVWSLTGTNYASGLAIGGGSGNLLWKGEAVSTASHTHSYLPLSGGNITGHVYLTGAQASSSTGNTTQLVFGTSSNNHVAITSNNNAIVINPTTSTTTGQIVLYLDKASSFPKGITGNCSSATKATQDGSGNVITSTYRKLTDTVPVTNGGTGGTTAAAARANLATWMYDVVSSASSSGTYPGLARPDGTTTGYVRTPQSGLLPYQNGGHGTVGTSSWPFNNGYFNNLYKGGKAVATVTWTSYTITPHSNVSASADTTWTCKYNASLGIVYVDGYVEYTPTAAVDAGTSIEIGTMPSALYPADTVALSCAAPSTNARRWMGSIGSSAGAIVVRSSSSLAKGTTYGLHVNAMYVI